MNNTLLDSHRAEQMIVIHVGVHSVVQVIPKDITNLIKHDADKPIFQGFIVCYYLCFKKSILYCIFKFFNYLRTERFVCVGSRQKCVKRLVVVIVDFT